MCDVFSQTATFKKNGDKSGSVPLPQTLTSVKASGSRQIFSGPRSRCTQVTPGRTLSGLSSQRPLLTDSAAVQSETQPLSAVTIETSHARRPQGHGDNQELRELPRRCSATVCRDCSISVECCSSVTVYVEFYFYAVNVEHIWRKRALTLINCDTHCTEEDRSCTGTQTGVSPGLDHG